MWQGSMCGRGASMVGGWVRAGQTAAETASTHPTLMHSCFLGIVVNLLN